MPPEISLNIAVVEVVARASPVTEQRYQSFPTDSMVADPVVLDALPAPVRVNWVAAAYVEVFPPCSVNSVELTPLT